MNELTIRGAKAQQNMQKWSRRDRLKGLYWEQDGFILLYKRLEEVYAQLSLLFNEAEMYAAEAEEPKETAVPVRAHTRKRKSGNARDILPENVEVVEAEHTLSEEERQCPRCGDVFDAYVKCSVLWICEVYLFRG